MTVPNLYTDHTLGDLYRYLARSQVLTCPSRVERRVKLSNASQPKCTSTSGEVHHVYMYITWPDTGTLLGHFNIAIIFSVYVSVCFVCVCVCVCVC